ncbi:DUF563 domain-containing protein [Gluconobacter sp. DsW_056]|uniref:glycosyltransferase family 61 protein n=1 Tax=Gluconobacter sp. DsW_056 TaxID=1511209 RepID=UPI000A3AA190|nr:glycosyltransferase 61 family protein [Gluconobacter sp. DsW_056]
MITKIIPNEISNRVFSYTSEIYHYNNALLIPQSPIGIDKKSGLYDTHGNLINQAAIFSGESNNLHIHVQEYKTNINFHDEHPEFDSLFWGGYFSDHYGHFLIETLPRLIRYSFIKNEKSVKIVFLSKKSKEHLASISWIRFFFEKLGIELEDIFIPLFPIKIKSVLFCSDYISEQNYINKDCKKLFSVFRKKDENKEKTQKPFAYISRKNLKSGTHKILNEYLIEEKLSSLGIIIFYPEEMSIDEQINIINNYKISGFLGSFFHNCLFSFGKCEFLCLSYGEKLNLNYSLLDYASESSGDYYVPELEVVGSSDKFYENSLIKNIDETCEFIMEWFLGGVEKSPSYFLQHKIHSYTNQKVIVRYQFFDFWGRIAKLSPHSGKIIFSESGTENDQLVDVVINQCSSGNFFISANSDYFPPIKVGKQSKLEKFIPVSLKQKEKYFYINISEDIYLTAIPKDGYSVSEVRHSQPDEWEQFSIKELIRQ